MAKKIASVADPRRKSEISDDEIEAATAAYLADEAAPPFAFKSGHTIDIPTAIEMHPQAKKLLADEGDRAGPAPHDGEDGDRPGLSGPGVSAADADPILDAVTALDAVTRGGSGRWPARSR